MFIKRKNADSQENNIFWVTMTDLMTALVLVFMVLFFYTYITSFYEKIERTAAQQRAAEALQETLQQKKLTAVIDASSGVVKISDLELFDLNSYELSPKGQQYLTSFAPAYLDSLFSNEYLSNHIDKIIIQGHTDSQTYKGEFSEDEQYMKNMELSLKRAYTVANFITSTPYNKVNGDKLRKMVIVEGASYSSPILSPQGKEDFAKSRRVELKIVMKEKNKYKDFIEEKEQRADAKLTQE